MGKIHKLPDHLIHKIAAGEVIERPSSVVKELVENSIDAGASQITVEIEEGGKKLIRVMDNGCGIPLEDLPLALAPHSTSKISSEEDLFNIHSLGFRGEALSSICAIAEVTLCSHPSDLDKGHKITSENLQPTPCAMTCGTILEVRNLFSRTPARRKFLKSTSSEFRHIVEIITKLALCYTQIHFTLRHNSKDSLLLPPASLADRIGTLFGREISEHLIPIELSEENYKISGFATPPSQSRKDTQWQYTFLNSRYIRDKILLSAIRNAMQDILMKGRYPVVFLFLQIPPAFVDVNVHPAKLEVRFVEEKKIYQMVHSALREKLDVPEIVPPMTFPQPPTTLQQEFFPPSLPVSRDYRTPSFPSSIPVKPGFSSPSQTSPFRNFSTYSLKDSNSSFFEPLEKPASTKENIDTMLSQVSKVVQIHNSYIVAEVPDGIRLIDQHALHEKVLYNRITQYFDSRVVEVQSLLIPEEIPLSPLEKSLFEEYSEIFHNMGFDFSIEEEKIKVLGHPLYFRHHSWEVFFKDLLSDLVERKKGSEILQENIIATMACKGAIKQGQSLSQEEIYHLIHDALYLPHTYTCAHGRPTYLSLSLMELELMFKRK